ncbi:MAG: PLP-dependent aminotransferase family protein [Solirubrobacteraceae bacterium]|nr:PLP-dependent aminotransferase family protein [Solirubrobacteraceae bacterium]
MARPGPVDGSTSDPVDAGGTDRRRVVDLGLALDRESRLPLPDQLERQLRQLLRRGELSAGAVLPSSRALASDLGVSRGIVVEAYDRLLRQGLLISQPGGAVRASSALHSTEPAAAGDAALPEPAVFALDLHPAGTPIGTLDRRAWGGALREVLRTATEAELASLDRAGLLSLREALVEQLSHSRGVVAVPEQVVVTSGVSDALRGLAPLLAQRGGRVAVEDPGFGLHRATLIGSGLDLVPVHADAGGIDVAGLEAHDDLAAVLVTPAHQMPLGVPLTPARRAALVDWSRRTGAWILEDDYDGELRYDRQGVRSLHGVAPDRVIYLGTTSKVLSPAIRVGWAVVPPELVEEVLAWRLPLGGAPSNLVQAGLAAFLRSGGFDRGVARLRRRCASHRAAIAAALTDALPDLEHVGVEAGLQIALRVPDIEPWRLIMAGLERGVQLFATDDGPDALLLIGYGAIEPAAAPRVAAVVAEIVAAGRASTRPH